MSKLFIAKLEAHLSQQFNIGNFNTGKDETSELHNARLRTMQELALEGRQGSWAVAERAQSRLNGMGRTLEVPAVDLDAQKRNEMRRILASARDFSVNHPRC